MTAWVNGLWMPNGLAETVLYRMMQCPKIPYARNRVYAMVRLITWMAQHQVLACRGTAQALIDSDTKWIRYSHPILAHYCGAMKISTMLKAAEDMGMMDVERNGKRIKRIRLNPVFWAGLTGTGVDTGA